ncbi:MAG: translation initiation factor IF-2 subunit alpha, partial [Nanoarchaeota archaeon]|nr:translation initiation factor IF-2 subunit alpha [Nanoarchaeota archaeon]
IRKALKAGEDAIKANNYKGYLTYIGAPHYRLELVFHDYKSAEEGMEKICSVIVSEMKKLGGAGSFKREED